MIKIPTLKNKKLQKLAFTHRSYLNEAKEKISSNERLEFLGDSILSYVVSQYLFNKYPNFNEGSLTNLRSLLVNTKNLAECSRELNFGNYLILSKGEEESRGRQNQSILANTFEAFIGALFLDRGIEEVSEFLNKVLLPKADFFVKSKSLKDAKSLLQEKIQAQKKGSPIYKQSFQTLVYKVIDEKGPAHAKTFTVGTYVNDKLIAKGQGPSKQKAEEEAAKEALRNLKQSLRSSNLGKVENQSF